MKTVKSPQQFLPRLYVVGHLFFNQAIFYFLCWRSIFVLKVILILPIYYPYLSSLLPQRRFLFCYAEGVAKISRAMILSFHCIKSVLLIDRDRRKKDKSSLMTMVFKVANPGHRTRCLLITLTESLILLF